MGPTASGKTNLALHTAKLLQDQGIESTIINFDSKQVYKELSILSARPTAEEESDFEHRLYGFCPASKPYSAGQWLQDALPALREALAQNKQPFLIGGTGLYLRCLTEGMSTVPAIPASISQTVHELWMKAGTNGLYAELLALDPLIKSRIDPDNPRRITRAMEVFMATGKSLISWQDNTPPPPFLPEQITTLTLQPEREWLYSRISQRVLTMVKIGALDEVNALTKLSLNPELPAMRTLGVSAFADHLAGNQSLEDAIAQTQQETRRYAKRQYTWIRQQMKDAISLQPDKYEISELARNIKEIMRTASHN